MTTFNNPFFQAFVCKVIGLIGHTGATACLDRGGSPAGMFVVIANLNRMGRFTIADLTKFRCPHVFAGTSVAELLDVIHC